MQYGEDNKSGSGEKILKIQQEVVGSTKEKGKKCEVGISHAHSRVISVVFYLITTVGN